MINFAYISIPKTASKSINQLLIDNGKKPYKNHESIYKYRDVEFSFSFVREPIERLKSWFYYHKQLFNNKDYDNKFDLSMYNCSFNEWVKKDFPIHWEFKKGYIKSLGINNPLNQCDFICKNGTLDIDFLGDYNSINNQIKIICEKLKFNINKLKIINNCNSKPNYIKLEQSTLSIIKKKFENDFKLYELLVKNNFLTKNTLIF